MCPICTDNTATTSHIRQTTQLQKRNNISIQYCWLKINGLYKRHCFLLLEYGLTLNVGLLSMHTNITQDHKNVIFNNVLHQVSPLTHAAITNSLYD